MNASFKKLWYMNIVFIYKSIKPNKLNKNDQLKYISIILCKLYDITNNIYAIFL